MKSYTKCGKSKKPSEFSLQSRVTGKLQAWCKPCMNEARTASYRANHHQQRAAQNERARKVLITNQTAMLDYLIQHPCVDCGEPNPVVLEFDHVRGTKANDISALMRRRVWSSLQEEMAKCDVRCANCHRRRTGIAGNWYKSKGV